MKKLFVWAGAFAVADLALGAGLMGEARSDRQEFIKVASPVGLGVCPRDGAALQGTRFRLRDLERGEPFRLPSGSTVTAYTADGLNEALARGELDAVVYPFDESYPLKTIDAVIAFVRVQGASGGARRRGRRRHLGRRSSRVVIPKLATLPIYLRGFSG